MQANMTWIKPNKFLYPPPLYKPISNMCTNIFYLNLISDISPSYLFSKYNLILMLRYTLESVIKLNLILTVFLMQWRWMNEWVYDWRWSIKRDKKRDQDDDKDEINDDELENEDQLQAHPTFHDLHLYHRNRSCHSSSVRVSFMI